MTPLPDGIALGPVRLRVADAARSGEWLERVLGMRRLADRAGRSAYGVEDPRALVELRQQPGARPVPKGGRPGIYHYAILLPSRADLGRFLLHLDASGMRHGGSDHLVSEAIYLVDPDGITVEVYADRPRERWSRRGAELELDSRPLDQEGLASAAQGGRWEGLPAGTKMGHVHHHVGDLAEAERFYVGGLGFDVTHRSLPGALFVSAAGYHHHVGLNTWAAARPPAGPEDAGLDEWTLEVPGAGARGEIEKRLDALGWTPITGSEGWSASDPWGITVRVTSGAAATARGA